MDEIKEQLNALHFEKALELLNRKSYTKESDLLRIRALRGVYRLEEALAISKNHEERAFLLERAKCLFGLGRIEEAKTLLKKMEPDTNQILTLASLYGEIGEVQQAMVLLEQLDEKELCGFVKMDLVLLKADLCSFQEKVDLAFHHYQHALMLVDECIPANWRSLRRMLIKHNMADTYEQLEQEEKAIEVYESALADMYEQRKIDDQITDLASYEMELLLSIANCFSNAQDFEQADHYLAMAQKKLSLLKKRSLPYFQARFSYISGLVFMNEEKEEAVAYFRQAYDLQKLLVEQGKDKLEHLARSAYYLGSLLDDSKKEEKLRLFDVATPIFEQVVEKEPSFYMGAIADIENEKGRLLGTIEHYDLAIDWYEKMLERNEEDVLAKESLIVTMINRMFLDPLSYEGKIQRELEQLRMEKENIPFLYSICELLHQQDHSAFFFDWLYDFENLLPDQFAA